MPYAANLFCSGHILLPDGRTLVVGGNVAADVGIKDTTLFDSQTNTWSKAADMSVARWYPTATVLGDGRVFVFGGDNIVDQGLPYSPSYFKEASQNSLPSIYDPATNTWTDLTGSTLTTPLYPFLFQLSDGRILDAGPDVTTRVINPATSTWSTIGTSPFDGGERGHVPAGQDHEGRLVQRTPTTTARNTYQATRAHRGHRHEPGRTRRGARRRRWHFPRTYQNMTMLPDGTVLASGGMTTSDGIDLTKAVLPAEIWNPATETWTTVASLTIGREYHSTALLLPDGRVLMAGGGQLPGPRDQHHERARSTRRRTSSRARGRRSPRAPSARSSTARASPSRRRMRRSIQKVALIRTPSVTHAFDENQRYIPLSVHRRQPAS